LYSSKAQVGSNRSVQLFFCYPVKLTIKHEVKAALVGNARMLFYDAILTMPGILLFIANGY